MDNLLIGGGLALYLRQENPRVSCGFATGLFCVSVIATIGIAITHPQTDLNNVPFMATFGYSILAMAYAALIFLAMQPGTLWNVLFNTTLLRNMGKYSYGMYVLHIFVWALVEHASQKLLGMSLRAWLALRLHIHPAAMLVEFIVGVSVIYAVAWLSYNLYEVRFLRLKRRFA